MGVTGTEKIYSPRKFDALGRVSQISAGNRFGLALMEDGTVRIWGHKWGSNSVRLETVPIDNVKAVSAGRMHALFLKRDGTVWAWGSNVSGQLGNGETEPPYNNAYPTSAELKPPVQVVGLKGIVAVSAGGDHSLALQADGTVWAGAAMKTDKSAPAMPPWWCFRGRSNIWAMSFPCRPEITTLML